MFGWHPLDPFGFGRWGYERASSHFSKLNAGRSDLVVAVTGPTSGLGLALTKVLAQAGCTVHMLCRNVEKGEQVKSSIQPNERLIVTKLDVSSLSDIQKLPELSPPVDVLVQNAGMIADKFEETSDGLESTVATHLVGPFALRNKIKPKRCIWVTSGGAYSKSLDVKSTFNPPRGADFSGVAAYAYCKRAQISLARLLGDDVMHPGWAESPGLQHSLPRFYSLTSRHLRTSEQGIDTIVWLILNPPEVRNFWFDRSPAPEHKFWTKSSPEEEKLLMETIEKCIESK